MANNRFTKDDLVAKGYVPFGGGWVKDITDLIPKGNKAPESIYMPTDTPQPTKPRKPKVSGLSGPSVAFRGLWLHPPTPEHRFDPSRRWRFDYAFIEDKVAVEVEGGVWIQGRHTRGSGFVKDMEKYNRAAELGWRVLRVQPQDLLKPEFIAQLTRTLTPE